MMQIRATATIGLVAWLSALALASTRLSQPSAQLNIRAIAAEAVDFDGQVCDASILAERGERPATIIASIDYSGRSLCNSIVRILPVAPPVVLQRFEMPWSS